MPFDILITMSDYTFNSALQEIQVSNEKRRNVDEVNWPFSKDCYIHIGICLFPI